MVPSQSLSTVSYSHSIATMAVSLAVLTQYTNVTNRHPHHIDNARRHSPRLCVYRAEKKLSYRHEIFNCSAIMPLNSPADSTLQWDTGRGLICLFHLLFELNNSISFIASDVSTHVLVGSQMEINRLPSSKAGKKPLPKFYSCAPSALD